MGETKLKYDVMIEKLVADMWAVHVPEKMHCVASKSWIRVMDIFLR